MDWQSTACRWVAMYVATWQQTLWTTAAYPIGGIGCIFQLGILLLLVRCNLGKSILRMACIRSSRYLSIA